MKSSATAICLIGYLCCSLCAAYNHASTRPRHSPLLAVPPSPYRHLSSLDTRASSLLLRNCNSHNNRRGCTSLRIMTIDVDDLDIRNEMSMRDSDSLLSWKDVLPLSFYATACLIGAIIISTYEDFDVTHTRPNPSTLRIPTSITRNNFNFWGAATRGMGWGPSNRGISGVDDYDLKNNEGFFEEWYGISAMTLQWKPSYNEIMLQHRSERVPRWNDLEINDSSSTQMLSAPTKMGIGTPKTKSNVVSSKEQLQQAVLQLYKSIDELDELKLMADDYMWDDMKDRLNPKPSTEMMSGYSLPLALEYSMDILKSMPSYYASVPDQSNINDQINPSKGDMKEVPEIIGFDWGSCAWRHCGAEADAQEAIAELQGSVGMLEPFECRFIIDVVERSIRDVLTIVPDDLKPNQNGSVLQVKPYEPYVSQAGTDEEGLGIDYEYAQALSIVRVDTSTSEE